MTKTVSISITVEIAGKSKIVIEKEIHPEQIGENLMELAIEYLHPQGLALSHTWMKIS